MTNKSFILALVVFLFLLPDISQAQRSSGGGTGGQQPQSPVQRMDEYLRSYHQMVLEYNELEVQAAKLTASLSGNQGQQKAALQQQKSAVSQRLLGLRLSMRELDSEMRIASHEIAVSSYRGDGAHGKAHFRPPSVQRIEFVKMYREGPVRSPNGGADYYNVALYKVIFSDGSSQQVEERSLVGRTR